MRNCCKWLTPDRRAVLTDAGRLLLRLYFGGAMLMAHGWGKLTNFADKKDVFPDPLGVGSTVSLTLAVSAEVGAALLVVAGLLTRLATIPLMATMAVAFFLVHGGDPFRKRELALVYLVGYLVILLLGPGKFSLDHLIFGRGHSDDFLDDDAVKAD